MRKISTALKPFLYVSASALTMAQPIAAKAQDAQQGQEAQQSQQGQQADQGAGLEEIIVTAQRRAENLQRAALAVSAIGGNTLEDRGVTSVADLTQSLPALNAVAAFGAFNVFSVRGVQGNQTNEFGDPAVAIYVDGTYLPRPTSAQGLFFDIDRIELLKGPQGTLYGRNSVAGALNVISKGAKLNSFEGNASIDVGNFDLIKINGALNLPLGETAAVRFAGQHINRDGYMSDGTSDDNTTSLRASLLWEPTSSTRIDLRANYVKVDSAGGGETMWCARNASIPALANCPANGGFLADPWAGIHDLAPKLYAAGYPYWSSFDSPSTFNPGPPDGLIASDPFTLKPLLKAENWGISLQIDQDLFGGTLSIIPTYRHEDILQVTTHGGGIRETSKTTQFTLEARYASPKDQRLSYIIGGFFSDDRHPGNALYDGQNLGNPFGAPAGSIQYQTTNVNSGKSYAAFGTLTMHLNETLRLTGGLRYTHDTKKLRATNGAVPYFVPSYFPDRSDLLSIPVNVLSGPGPLVGPNGYLVFISPTLGSQQGQESVYQTDSDASWDSVDWRAGVEWDAAPHSLVYLTVASGYKAGGFFLAPNGIKNTYEPERLTSFTLGSKNRFLDNRLQVNAEAFYWKYKNQQVGTVRFLDPAGAFVGLPLANAEKATIYGFELETEFLATETTQLSFGVQYQHGKYDSYHPLFAFFNPQPQCQVSGPQVGGNIPYDCSGLPLLNQPHWILTGGIQQKLPLANGGQFVFDVNGRFEDKQLLGYASYQHIGSYLTTNATIAYESPEHWRVQAYINNITNEAIPTGIYSAFNSTGTTAAGVRPPRTFGVRLSADF